MQLGARCSGGSCEAAEDLIAGFSAIEAEAELVQVRLKMCAATMICAKQKCFQVADGFVQPMQVAGFILFRVQRNARQVLNSFCSRRIRFLHLSQQFCQRLAEVFCS